MNLPNKLTLLRMLMSPLFVACFYLPVPWWNWAAAFVFVAAFTTDILDGRYARAHNMVTDFGKLMDPMADKVITACALVMMVSFDMLHPVFALIMLVREFVVSGFRLVSAGSGRVIAANWLGKAKTLTQSAAIVLLLLRDPLISWLGFPLDSIVLWISLLFTLWSAWDYIYKNRGVIVTK